MVGRAKNERLQGEITAEMEAAALVAVVGDPEAACTLAEGVAGGCRQVCVTQREVVPPRASAYTQAGDGL